MTERLKVQKDSIDKALKEARHCCLVTHNLGATLGERTGMINTKGRIVVVSGLSGRGCWWIQETERFLV